MPVHDDTRPILVCGAGPTGLVQQDNYAPLTTLDWQLHCYGPAPATVTNWCASIQLPLHIFTPADPINRDTLCLIRPDGYIGWIGRPGDQQALTRYAAQWCVTRDRTGISPRDRTFDDYL